MRVLITSVAGTGHIHPIVPLARALQRAGHNVAWATAADSCAIVRELGFTASSAGLNAAERHAQFQREFPGIGDLPPDRRRARTFAALFGSVAAPTMYSDLRPIFDSFNPDVVVHEIGELAAPAIAAGRGVPHVTVAFSGTLPPELVANVEAAMAAIWAAEGLSPGPTMGWFDHLYLHPFPAQLGPLPDHSNVVLTRPLSPDDNPRDEPTWLPAIGEQRPAIYITFGTTAATPQSWDAVFEGVAGLDVDVVATTGRRVSFASRVPPNVIVEPYVPQSLVLGRVHGMISHAGAGTMLGAAARGVPQLCLPAFADQFDNTTAILQSGAAITLDLDHRDAASIGGAVQRLLSDPELSRSASLLSASIAAMPHPADHVDAIASIVESKS